MIKPSTHFSKTDMDTHTAQAYQDQLMHMRSALLARIAEQRGGTRSRAEVAAEHFAHSEDSPAQVNTARDLEFALNEHETAELAAIEAALSRLSQGSFGQCSDCDATIPAARLKATPQAARCMACQEKNEHAHG